MVLKDPQHNWVEVYLAKSEVYWECRIPEGGFLQLLVEEQLQNLSLPPLQLPSKLRLPHLSESREKKSKSRREHERKLKKRTLILASYQALVREVG